MGIIIKTKKIMVLVNTMPSSNLFPNIYDSFRHVKRYPGPWIPEQGKEFELDQLIVFINNLKNYSREATTYYNSKDGLKITSDFKGITNPSTAEKKIGLYTNISAFRLDPLQFTIDSDDPTSYDEVNLKISSIIKRIEPYKKTQSEGIMLPIPSEIEEYDGIVCTSKKYDLSKDLKVAFSNNELEKQFSEEFQSGMPLLSIDILQPHVTNLPLQSILELRKDYQKNFTRFQNELVSFIEASNSVSTKDKLLDLLRKIDNEVYRLQGEFDAISRKEELAKENIVFSFGAMTLVPFIPSNVAQSLITLLGASEIVSSYKNLRLLEIERFKLEADPFYIPFHLSQLSKNMPFDTKDSSV